MKYKEKDILRQLSEAVVDMDDDKIGELCKKVIDLKMDPQEAILDGLTDGMKKVGELYEEGTYSIPELLICSDTLNIGLDTLKPYLKDSHDTGKKYPNIVIGTVEGDIHSIGKNLVNLMLGVFGFSMTDLGEDVNYEKFLKGIDEKETKIVALSTMMTNTLGNMKDIVNKIREKYPKMFIIIGGACVSQNMADNLGVDGFGTSAFEAVNLCKKLLGIKDE